MIYQDTLKRNLEAIKLTSPITYKWLSQNFDKLNDIDKKITKNKKQMWDFKLDNGLMMEGFPLSHYFSWATADKVGLYVVVGANVGYGVALLLEKSPSFSKIIVIEPNAEMIFATLTIADYSPFIKKGKIIFLPPEKDVINDFFDNLTPFLKHTKTKLFIDPPSARLTNSYIRMGQTIKNIIDDKMVVLSTILRLQKTFVTNELLNFYNVFKDRTLRPLTGQKRDLIAVILGAGPSLEHFLPHLKDFKDKCLFTTSLQTLPACFIKGFQPHLCMAIDPSKVLTQVFNKVTEDYLKQILFVYSPKIDPEVVDRYPGCKFSIWSSGGIGSDIKKTYDLVIDTGGNVSIGLIRLLHLIGIKKFILVGQDFSWKETKTHSTGHHGANTSIQFDPNIHIKLKNLYGEVIYSTKSYLAAARELESDIRKHKLEVYNLYGGGVEISGAKNITIKDFKSLVEDSNKNELNKLLNDLTSNKTERYYFPHIPFESKQWFSSINNFEKRLKKLYKKSKNNKNKIRSAYYELHIFLTQHPLYKYYIYNEILELSKYIFIQEKYKLSDLAYTKKIIDKIKKKLKYLDNILEQQHKKIKKHFTLNNISKIKYIAA